MDSELARTFLAVVSAGNFSGAAGRLHVSQSTVSARIQSLEQQLGCVLFLRNKAGTSLTPAGRRFERHAAQLVRTVEQARQDVGVPSGFRASLTVGGRFGLWERLLLEWLPQIRRQEPDVLLRAEIGFEPELMRGLVEGRLDIAVMYTPESRPGLVVELLLEERLLLVEGGRGDYLLVDWGPEFRARHAASFPEPAAAPVGVNLGWLGLQYILANGGSGYFPERLLRPHLESGRLALVPEAPSFSLPAYVAYPAAGEAGLIGRAVASMAAVAERVGRAPG